ncbi:MAG: hypothetical protein NTW59_03050 [Candidatus Diapherotrites archaeon]|nr:hypothetical protein [Candidatus Diapherotrites archaeon]
MPPKPRSTAILVRYKPLPKDLVTRVKRIVRRREARGAEGDIYRFLARTKNIDPRAGALDWIEPNPLDKMPVGHRVRELNVSRNFPGNRLVIKALDWPMGMKRPTAKEFVSELRRIAADHNKKYPNEDYTLLAPPVKAVGKELVAMPWLRAPSIQDLFPPKGEARTKESAVFLERFKEQTGVSEQRLLTAAGKASQRVGNELHNIWVLGVRRGKIIFMLPADRF